MPSGVQVYSPARALPIRPSGTLANAGTARSISTNNAPPVSSYNPRSPSMARPRNTPARITVPQQPQFGPMAFQQPSPVGGGAGMGTPADQLLASVRAGGAQQQQNGPFSGGLVDDFKGALGVAANSAPGRAILGSLDVLARPRRAVLSTIHEISDAVGDGDASWNDWLDQFNDPSYGVGKYVDTGNWFLDGTLGFLGDVVVDPLTWVSGSSVLGGVGRAQRLAVAEAIGTGGVGGGGAATEALASRVARRGVHFLDNTTREAVRTATNEAGEHVGVNLLNRGYYFRLPRGVRPRIPGTGVIEPYLSGAFGRVRTGLAGSGVGSYLRSRVSTPVGLVPAVERLITGKSPTGMSALEAIERLNMAHGIHTGNGVTLRTMEEGARVLIGDTPGGNESLSAMIHLVEQGEDNVAGQYFRQGAKIIKAEGGSFPNGERANYVPHMLTQDADALRRGLDPTSEDFLSSVIRGTSAEDESARMLERGIQPNTDVEFAGRTIHFGDDVTIAGKNKAFAEAFPEVQFKMFEDNFETIAARYAQDVAHDAGQLRGWRNVYNSRSGLVRPLDDVSDWKINETQTAMKLGTLSKESEAALKTKMDTVAQLRQAQKERLTGIQGVLGVHMHDAIDGLTTVAAPYKEELSTLLTEQQRLARLAESQGERIPTGVAAGTATRRGETTTLTEGLSNAEIRQARAAAKARMAADEATGGTNGRIAPDYFREEVARIRGVAPEAAPSILEERLNGYLAQLQGRADELDAAISANSAAAAAERSQYNAERGRLEMFGKVGRKIREYRALELERQLKMERAAITVDRESLQTVRDQLHLTRTKKRILEGAIENDSFLNLAAGPGESRLPAAAEGEVRVERFDEVTGKPITQRRTERPLTQAERESAGTVSGTRSTAQVRMEAATEREQLIMGVGDRALADTQVRMRETAQQLSAAEAERDVIWLRDAKQIATTKSLYDEAVSEHAKAEHELGKLMGSADPDAAERRLEMTRVVYVDMQAPDSQLGYATQAYNDAKRELDVANSKVDRFNDELEQLRDLQMRQARQWDEAGNATLIDPQRLGRTPRQKLPMNPQQERYVEERLIALRTEAAAFDASPEGQRLAAASTELDEVTSEITRIEHRVGESTRDPLSPFSIDDEGNVTLRRVEGDALHLVEQRDEFAGRANIAKADRDAARAMIAKGERGMLDPEELAGARARYDAAAAAYKRERRAVDAINAKLRRRGYRGANVPVPERMQALAETVQRDAAALDGLRARQQTLETFITQNGLAKRTRDMNIEVLAERNLEQVQARQLVQATAPRRALSLEDSMAKINTSEANAVAKSRNFGVPTKFEYETITPETTARSITQARQEMGRIHTISPEDEQALRAAHLVRRNTPQAERTLDNAAYQEAMLTIKEMEGQFNSTVSKHQAAALQEYASIRRRIANARAGTVYSPSPEFRSALDAMSSKGGNTELAGRVQTAVETADAISDRQLDTLVSVGAISEEMAQDIRDTTDVLEELATRYGGGGPDPSPLAEEGATLPAQPSPPLYRDIEYLISKSSIQSGTVNSLHLANELGVEITPELSAFMLRREVYAERLSITNRLSKVDYKIRTQAEVDEWTTWEAKTADIQAEIRRLQKIEATQKQIKNETGRFGDDVVKANTTQRISTLQKDLREHKMKYPQFGADHDAVNMLAARLFDDYSKWHLAADDMTDFAHLSDIMMKPSELREELGTTVKYREALVTEARAQNQRIRRAIDRAKAEGRTTVRYSPSESSREIMFIPELEAAIKAGEIDPRLVPMLRHKIKLRLQEEAKARTYRSPVPDETKGQYLANDLAQVGQVPPPGPVTSNVVEGIGMDAPDLTDDELWAAVRGLPAESSPEFPYSQLGGTPYPDPDMVRLFTPDRSGYVDVSREEFFRIRVRNAAAKKAKTSIPTELKDRVRPYTEPPPRPVTLDRPALFEQTGDTRPLQGPMPARELPPGRIGVPKLGKGKLKEVSLEQAEIDLKMSNNSLDAMVVNLERDNNTLSVLNGTAQREYDAITENMREQVRSGIPDREQFRSLNAKRRDLKMKLEATRQELFGTNEMLAAQQDEGVQLLTALTHPDRTLRMEIKPEHLPILRDLFGGMMEADLVATFTTRMNEMIDHFAMSIGGGRATPRGAGAYTDLQFAFDDFISEVRNTIGEDFASALSNNVHSAYGQLLTGEGLDLKVIGQTREYMFNTLIASARAAKANARQDIIDQLKLLGLVTGDTSRFDLAQLGFVKLSERGKNKIYDPFIVREWLMGKFKALGVDVRQALPDQKRALEARLAQLKMIEKGLGGKIYPSELHDPEWLFTAMRAQKYGLDMDAELKMFQRFGVPEGLDDVQAARYMQIQGDIAAAINSNDDAALTAAMETRERFLGIKPREGTTAAIEESNAVARENIGKQMLEIHAAVSKIDPQIEALDNLSSTWNMTLRDMIDDPNTPSAPAGKYTRAQRFQAIRDMDQAAAQSDAIGTPEAHDVFMQANLRARDMADNPWPKEPDEFVERAVAINKAMSEIKPSSLSPVDQRAALVTQREAHLAQLESLESEGRLIPPPGSIDETLNMDVHAEYQTAVDNFNERLASYPGGVDGIPPEEIPVINQMAERIVELKEARDADVTARFAESVEADPNFQVRAAVEAMGKEAPSVTLDWEHVFMTGIGSRDAVRARMDATNLALRKPRNAPLGMPGGEQETLTTRGYLRGGLTPERDAAGKPIPLTEGGGFTQERPFAPLEAKRAEYVASLAQTQEQLTGQTAIAGRAARTSDLPERTAAYNEGVAELQAERAALADETIDPVAGAVEQRRQQLTGNLSRLHEERGPLEIEKAQVADRIGKLQTRYTRELQRNQLQLGEVRAKVVAAQTEVDALDQQTATVRRALEGKPPDQTTELRTMVDDLNTVHAMRTPGQVPDNDVVKTEALLDAAIEAQLDLEYEVFDQKLLELRTQQFRDGSAEIESVLTRIVHDGWTQMAQDIFPDTEGVAVADGLAKALKNLSDALIQPQSWKLLDQYTQFFKTYATMTPGFHVRNGMSGIFMNYVDGVETRHMARAPGLWREFETDPFGFMESLASRPDGAKLRTAFEAVLGSGAGGQFMESGLGAAPTWTAKGYQRLMNNTLTKWNRKAGSYVEGSLRLGMALDSIENGASLQQALGRITKFHFDYTQVSKFDRTAKRFIPFWTFISRNLPLQIEQMWLRPKAYLMYQSFVRNFGETPGMFTPDYWLRQGAFTLDKGAATADGDEAPWYLAPDLPFTRVTAPIDALMHGDLGAAVLSDMNPLFMAPIEAYGAHQKFFTGQPIEGYSAPQGAMSLFTPLFQMLGMTETGGTTGDTLVPNSAQHLLRTLLPPVNLAERLTSNEGVREGRQGETLYRALGAPVYRETPGVRQSTRNSRAAARRNARDQQAELARS